MNSGTANTAGAIAPENRVRQIETAVFLIPFITYAYFYQGSDQSIACRFDLMRSMIEKWVLWINDFCGFNTADIITVHGHIYSVKAPGTSYTALIPWLVFKFVLKPLSAAHEPLYWAFVTYLTTVFTTGLLIAAMCVVMFRFARFLGASQGRAAAVALILGLATIAFPYATELTGESVAAACVFTAFYLLATAFSRDGRCSTITRSSWSPPRSESTRCSNCPAGSISWRFPSAPRSPSQSCSPTTGLPSAIRCSSVTRRSSSRPPKIVNSPSKRSDSSA
jgi:hypothetical protein